MLIVSLLSLYVTVSPASVEPSPCPVSLPERRVPVGGEAVSSAVSCCGRVSVRRAHATLDVLCQQITLSLFPRGRSISAAVDAFVHD